MSNGGVETVTLGTAKILSLSWPVLVHLTMLALKGAKMGTAEDGKVLRQTTLALVTSEGFPPELFPVLIQNVPAWGKDEDIWAIFKFRLTEAQRQAEEARFEHSLKPKKEPTA